MWVLTTLVKVSNFTNEVYDLHYVSSIIAEAINCSEFWTLTAFHTWSLSRIRPKCGAYWATGAVANCAPNLEHIPHPCLEFTYMHIF